MRKKVNVQEQNKLGMSNRKETEETKRCEAKTEIGKWEIVMKRKKEEEKIRIKDISKKNK